MVCEQYRTIGTLVVQYVYAAEKKQQQTHDLLNFMDLIDIHSVFIYSLIKHVQSGTETMIQIFN